MNKEKKDKFIGIFGVILSIISLSCFKIFTYYNVVILNESLTILILFTLVVIGAFLSKRYFNILFGVK